MRILQRAAMATIIAFILPANAPNQPTASPVSRPIKIEALPEPAVVEEVQRKPAPSLPKTTTTVGGGEAIELSTQNEYVADDNELYPESVSGYDAARAGRAGLLGNSLLLDILALLIVTIFGAVLSIFLASRRSARAGVDGEIAQLKRRIDQMETGLRAQAKLSPSAVAEPYRNPSSNDPYAVYRTGSGRASSSDPHSEIIAHDRVSEARSNQQEVSRRLIQNVSDYTKLVITRGAKPRQFADILARFPQVMAIQQQGSSLIAAPFREGDANQFLVAAGDGETFSVLPTYEYVADFAIAFSKPVMNPELVRRLFELGDDDTGQLQLAAPATVELDESGVFHLARKGQLSGFRS